MRNFFLGIFHPIRAFFSTLAAIFTDKGVLMLTIVAPIIYAFYYPFPYSSQIIHHAPVAIVDQANDSLSRQIIRFATAAPEISVTVVDNEHIAKTQLSEFDIVAFMVIPSRLRADIIQGKATTINMIGHGGYLLPSKKAQQAMAAAVGTVSAGIEIKRLSAAGLSQDNIAAIRDPVPLRIDPIHNANEGYASYVVPAVIWLILQQSLLMGCAMLVGTWFEQKKADAEPAEWVARVLAISVVHYAVCIGYTGWVFSFWGYPAGGNSEGNLLLIGLFSPCVAIIGCILGLLIKNRERSMQLLVVTALPIFFISGFSWPSEQLPLLLQWMRWLAPSTSAINAGVNLNQLGGTVAENSQYFYALSILGLLSLCLLFWLGRPKSD